MSASRIAAVDLAVTGALLPLVRRCGSRWKDAYRWYHQAPILLAAKATSPHTPRIALGTRPQSPPATAQTMPTRRITAPSTCAAFQALPFARSSGLGSADRESEANPVRSAEVIDKWSSRRHSAATSSSSALIAAAT